MSYEYSSLNHVRHQNAVLPSVQLLNASTFKLNPITIRRGLSQPPNLLNSLNSKPYFCVKKCSLPRCKTCDIITVTKEKIVIADKTIFFNADMNCNSKNVVYVLTCRSCKLFYVGETNTLLRLRINLHRQHINNPHYSFLYVSSHIRQCGGQFDVAPICHIDNNSSYILRKTEKYFINLLHPKLNQTN